MSNLPGQSEPHKDRCAVFPRGYLPMDCPTCGRRRLEYGTNADGGVIYIECERCGANSDDEGSLWTPRDRLGHGWDRQVPARWVYDWLHEVQSGGLFAHLFAQVIIENRDED